MMKVTVFKQKPYSEEYTNPLGVKTFRTMEYPPNHVDVELVLDIIRQEKLKPGIDTIRSFYDTDTQMYSELKGKLPVCLFAGTFGRFSNAAFITPSGLVTVDFDKIPVHAMSDVRNMIVQDEYTYASFLSPGGRGYKTLVRVADNIDNTSYNEYLEALKEYYDSPFWDDNCKGICRACYLSSAPNLYMNRGSRIWTRRKPVTSTPVVIHTITQPHIPIYSSDEVSKIIKFLEGGFGKFPMIPGSRHDSTFKRARELAEWGIPETAAYANLSKYIAPDFSEPELKREIWKAYKWVDDRGKIGTKYRKF